jgi:hypothetical protein
MNKWVCITNELTHHNFTYGKIYEGKSFPLNNLLDTRNDLGVKKLVQYYSDIPIGDHCHDSLGRGPFGRIENFKESERTYFFIELEEWRNQQIDKII